MFLLTENQAELIKEPPKKIANNYDKLLQCIQNLVDTVNAQTAMTIKEEYTCFGKIKEHSEIVSRMLKEVKKETDLLSSYIDLCDDKIRCGDDIDGTYKRQKKAFQRLLQDDKKLLAKLQSGERDYKRSISEIRKMFENLEE